MHGDERHLGATYGARDVALRLVVIEEGRLALDLAITLPRPCAAGLGRFRKP